MLNGLKWLESGLVFHSNRKIGFCSSTTIRAFCAAVKLMVIQSMRIFVRAITGRSGKTNGGKCRMRRLSRYRTVSVRPCCGRTNGSKFDASFQVLERNLSRHYTPHHLTARHNTAPHNTTPHDTALHGTSPHSTAHHSTTPHATTQHWISFKER